MGKKLVALLAFAVALFATGHAQTYRGMADVSFNLGSFNEGGLDPIISASVSTTHGIQIHRNHFVGLGLQYSPVSHWYDYDGLLKKALPIYVMWRMDFFSTHKCSFFFDLRPGYQAGTTSGFYMGGNAGIRIALTKRSGLNISLGGEMSRIGLTSHYHDDGWLYPNVGVSGSPARFIGIYETNALLGSVRIGFDF